MMEWKYVVIEHKKKQSEIILLNSYNPEPVKPVWNILFTAPFDPNNPDETMYAFDGCMTWIELNKVEGSEYLITEMFFV